MSAPSPVDEQVWLDAWNSQRAGPVIKISDPEVEVHAVTLGIEGRHFRGHEGLRDWMREIGERFGAHSHAEAIEPLADDAVMISGTLFVPDGYGGEQQQRFVMVVHLRNGKARWIGTFFSAGDAKQAYESGVTGPSPGNVFSMPRIPGTKVAMPWMRVVLAFQIIMAGIQELEAHERRRARDIVQRFARDRRISSRDRDELLRLARKAGRGAGRRAMPGGRKRERG